MYIYIHIYIYILNTQFFYESIFKIVKLLINIDISRNYSRTY